MHGEIRPLQLDPEFIGEYNSLWESSNESSHVIERRLCVNLSCEPPARPKGELLPTRRMWKCNDGRANMKIVARLPVFNATLHALHSQGRQSGPAASGGDVPVRCRPAGRTMLESARGSPRVGGNGADGITRAASGSMGWRDVVKALRPMRSSSSRAAVSSPHTAGARSSSSSASVPVAQVRGDAAVRRIQQRPTSIRAL